MRYVYDLVGRERELGELAQALGQHRLVTVCGPAGVGKSRLVQEHLPHAPRLALKDVPAERLAQLAARALDIEAQHAAHPQALRRTLARLPAPLVLDGASPSLAAQLATWLHDCPTLRLVVTSVQPLGVEREHAFPLEPLAAHDARALWRHALGIASHDDALSDAITERLDRLPQALLWYAPRAALVGEPAALERLRRDVDQRPLPAALEQALDTLTSPQRQLLERIAMYATGAPIGHIDALLDGDLDDVDVLLSRALARTEHTPSDPQRATEVRVVAYHAVAQPLMRQLRTEQRWLELARQHAERVVAQPDASRAELDAVVDRLAEAAPTLARRALVARTHTAVADGSAARTLDAFARLPGSETNEPDAELAQARLERSLGRLEQARARLDRVADDGIALTLERAHLDRMQSRTDVALAGYERALTLAEQHGSASIDQAHGDGLVDHGRAVALGELGRMLQSVGRFEAAQTRHRAAIALQHSLGMTRREALERSLYARATHRAGAIREAIGLHRQALAMHERHGQRRLAAAERGHLGFCHHELAEHAAAEALFRQSVEGLAGVGDVVLECIERTLLARLLVDDGRRAEARLELAIVEEASRQVPMPRVELTRLFVMALAAIEDNQWTVAVTSLQHALELGLHAEVGFEALLPTHLAWLLSTTDAAHPAGLHELVDHGARSVAAIENDALKCAHALLTARVRGHQVSEPPAPLLARSSDVRRVWRWTQQHPLRGYRVASDGRSLQLADGTRVALGRRAAPRRLLLTLTRARLEQPGEALDADTLIEAGWPGERMRADAARKRLRTAVWTLRKLGLEALLLTRDDGYLFDPHASVQWSPAD